MRLSTLFVVCFVAMAVAACGQQGCPCTRCQGPIHVTVTLSPPSASAVVSLTVDGHAGATGTGLPACSGTSCDAEASVGSHEVVVSAPGYASETRTVAVQPAPSHCCACPFADPVVLTLFATTGADGGLADGGAGDASP